MAGVPIQDANRAEEVVLAALDPRVRDEREPAQRRAICVREVNDMVNNLLGEPERSRLAGHGGCRCSRTASTARGLFMVAIRSSFAASAIACSRALHDHAGYGLRGLADSQTQSFPTISIPRRWRTQYRYVKHEKRVHCPRAGLYLFDVRNKSL